MCLQIASFCVYAGLNSSPCVGEDHQFIHQWEASVDVSRPRDGADLARRRSQAEMSVMSAHSQPQPNPATAAASHRLVLRLPRAICSSARTALTTATPLEESSRTLTSAEMLAGRCNREAPFTPSLAASRCPTARDFVPWRFSAAGHRSAWRDRHSGGRKPTQKRKSGPA
jgi:hypothetical protein